jgi:hypothetical protein
MSKDIQTAYPASPSVPIPEDTVTHFQKFEHPSDEKESRFARAAENRA